LSDVRLDVCFYIMYTKKDATIILSLVRLCYEIDPYNLLNE